MALHELISDSPKQRVMVAASNLEDIRAGDDVESAFMTLRTALWELIEVSDDPDAYMISWNTVAKYALAELLEYQETGNTDALERLKDKVSQAMEFL
ncbi:hypothetical protein [Spirosoma gilvum]